MGEDSATASSSDTKEEAVGIDPSGSGEGDSDGSLEAGGGATAIGLPETAGESVEAASSDETPSQASRNALSSADDKPKTRVNKPRIVPPAATNEHVRKSMQGNKNKNTKPELVMRARLRAAGLTGYRLQWKAPGRPDIAWPGKRVCIQVMGCFWHRCPHCRPSTPKSHIEYWYVKFERNVERDERTLAQLREEGWTVHVVWECQLKKKTIDDTLRELFPLLSQELGKPLVDGWDS